jgi:hypothetical protein
LIADGWDVCVYSCRPPDIVDAWLRSHGFPDGVYAFDPQKHDANPGATKPIAQIYGDDRGIQFNGNWMRFLWDVRQFKPWWQK